MNVQVNPHSDEAFERLYQTSPDPWSFATSRYENGRYAATLAALSRPEYGTAFEPGCSVGVLTAALATRCDRVLATDISPTAIARARERCRQWPHVEFQCADVSAGLPVSSFDLVVLSEIGYYFEKDALATLARDIERQMEPGGELIAVHWLGCSQDHVLHGDTVHDILKETLKLRWFAGERHAGFRIDSWVRA